MGFLEPSRFKRQATGLAMVIAPLVIVIAELLHAKFETDAAKQIEAVADNPGRWYAAHVLVLLAVAGAVPAFLGLAHILRRARPGLAHLSLVLFVPGAVALAAVAGMEIVLWQMAQPEASRAEMVALAERLDESAGVAGLFAVVLLFPLAWLLAGIGLYVSRLVPVWAAVAIAVAQPVGFAGELAGGPKALAVAAQVAFAIGLVPVGIAVLKQSDQAWDEPAAPGVTPATA
ncbi:MAG: hypothetical protein ACRDNY_06930 [Gaiellaceae bacterium]